LGISFVRTIILYITVIAAVRIMGKREIGELQPSELVVAILISELAAIPMQETGIPLASGVIPILTLIACEIVLSSLTMLSHRARRIISGSPSVLILNGVIDQKEMRRLRFTIDDLLEELRISGYMSASEVAVAVAETNGKLSIFPAAACKPVTAGMMGIAAPDGGLPVTVISDGEVSLRALKKAGRDEPWLSAQLAAQKLAPKDVFLMTVDNGGAAVIIPRQKG
jgi:uncharacterized membrane protein YcaP (DUF421 family)